jgi:Excreted virulence factor EspC, type VII ESX diderm
MSGAFSVRPGQLASAAPVFSQIGLEVAAVEAAVVAAAATAGAVAGSPAVTDALVQLGASWGTAIGQLAGAVTHLGGNVGAAADAYTATDQNVI